MENNNRLIIKVLYLWIVLINILYIIIGINWFKLGDFDWQIAMVYHGTLIPCWLILVLNFSYTLELSSFIRKILEIGTLISSFLIGLGVFLIHKPSINPGTIIQVIGMFIADIISLGVIIYSFIFYFKKKKFGENIKSLLAWWCVLISLMIISLATPLGHLGGALRDLGVEYQPFISKFIENPGELMDSLIGSHSHQIVTGFLVVGFTFLLIFQNINKFIKIVLYIIIISNICQMLLYQFSVLFNWQPPTLFENGPNGMPLDDFILSILGIGLLLLLPRLFYIKNKVNNKKFLLSNIGTGLLILSFFISVIGLGIFIEFNEGFFGHGEGIAKGVNNALAYIRAHLVYGFMIIPLLLILLINFPFFYNSDNLNKNYFILKNIKIDKFKVIFLLIIVIILLGTLGTFIWTFYLNPILIKISFSLTLLVFLLNGCWL